MSSAIFKWEDRAVDLRMRGSTGFSWLTLRVKNTSLINFSRPRLACERRHIGDRRFSLLGGDWGATIGNTSVFAGSGLSCNDKVFLSPLILRSTLISKDSLLEFSWGYNRFHKWKLLVTSKWKQGQLITFLCCISGNLKSCKWWEELE